jgi:hypothetical protein
VPQWWDSAIWDTCSLITLDLILQCDEGLGPLFGTPLYVEPSLSKDNLRPETAARIQRFVGSPVAMPDLVTLHQILHQAQLSRAISDVDQAVFAAAVHHGFAVATGDIPLAKALKRRRHPVGNVLTILQELVRSGRLAEADCNALLQQLEEQEEYLLPPDGPKGWAGLRSYRFP